MTPKAFIDIETTGLRPDIHQVIEVGYVLQGGSYSNEVEFSLAFDPRDADPEALKVNRYYERAGRLREIQLPPLEAAKQLMLDLAGRVFIANSPAFDAAFLARFLRHHGFEAPWHFHLIDVKSMAYAALGAEPTVPTERLFSYLDVQLPDDLHAALPDARLARDVYYAALRHTQSLTQTAQASLQESLGITELAAAAETEAAIRVRAGKPEREDFPNHPPED